MPSLSDVGSPRNIKAEKLIDPTYQVALVECRDIFQRCSAGARVSCVCMCVCMGSTVASRGFMSSAIIHSAVVESGMLTKLPGNFETASRRGERDT